MFVSTNLRLTNEEIVMEIWILNCFICPTLGMLDNLEYPLGFSEFGIFWNSEFGILKQNRGGTFVIESTRRSTGLHEILGSGLWKWRGEPDALGVHFSSFGGARGGVSGSKYPEDTTLPIVSTWNPISCKWQWSKIIRPSKAKAGLSILL